MIYSNIIKEINKGSKNISKSFQELIEAFEKEGCPICRVIDFSTDNYFESILYEFVNDPKVRKDLRESLGYCPSHSDQLKKIVEKSYHKLGASIIIEDIIKEFIKKFSEFSKLSLKQLKNINILNQNCPACVYQNKYENIYYLEISDNLENEDFFKRFSKSEGLCFSHLAGLLKTIKNSAVRNKIIENQKLKLIEINEELNAFINKHDYQNKEKITSGEAKALGKALKKMMRG